MHRSTTGLGVCGWEAEDARAIAPDEACRGAGMMQAAKYLAVLGTFDTAAMVSQLRRVAGRGWGVARVAGVLPPEWGPSMVARQLRHGAFYPFGETAPKVAATVPPQFVRTAVLVAVCSETDRRRGLVSFDGKLDRNSARFSAKDFGVALDYAAGIGPKTTKDVFVLASSLVDLMRLFCDEDIASKLVDGLETWVELSVVPVDCSRIGV